MKRTLLSSAVCAVALLTVSGCAASTTAGGASNAPAADAVESVDGVVKIDFWHSMDGTNGKVLQELVDKFNAANDGKIEVEAVFQGSYDDAITKYKAAIQSASTPAVFQAYGIGTQFMIDTQNTVPIQAFVDRDDWDTSDLQPAIAGYYQQEGDLVSMPFSNSTPVLYYNKTLFEQAGLDPEAAPTTLAEITEAAGVLSKANGGPAEYGYAVSLYGWNFEQYFAVNGQNYCTPENGRGADRAIAFDVDAEIGQEYANWMKDLVDTKSGVLAGRADADAFAAFQSGKAAMVVASSGTLSAMMAAGEEIGYEVGVTNFPSSDAASWSGPSVGGASLWITREDHSDADQEAAWRLIQFLSTPESQATWHLGTGYLPVSVDAQSDSRVVERYEAEPQYQVALDQLNATEVSSATQACLIGVMPQSRAVVEESLEAILLGEDAATALTKANETLTGLAEEYNDSVGG